MHASEPLNWTAGWSLILAAFAAGAVAGLFFHRDDFLGGYDSFRRRLLRLGHVALAALGMINVLFSVAPPAGPHRAASLLLVAGGATMGPICYLTAWRAPFRHLFFIPVAALVIAVVLILAGGAP